MHRPRARRLVLAALSLILLGSNVGATEIKVPLGAESADVAGKGDLPSTLRLDAPDGWRSRIRQPAAGASTLIEFSPAAGDAFKVMLVVLAAREGASPPTRESVAAGVARSASKASERSVEPAPLRLHELVGQAVYGSYFSATDREPGSGYAHLTQGMAVVDGVAVGFTVLANGYDAPAIARSALHMLRAARRTP